MASQQLQFGITEPRRRIRFSWILPLGQLVLCALILWPARSWIFYEFGVPQGLNIPSLAAPLSPWSYETGFKVTTMLNLPAGLLQFPSAIFSADHNELHPRKVDFRVWRAVTWPVIGMFFWWIAGRGAEALVAVRRSLLLPNLRWVEAVIGLLLLALGLILTIGFVFSTAADRRDPGFRFLIISGVLWTFLGALPFTAKIMQWRLLRKATLAAQS